MNEGLNDKTFRIKENNRMVEYNLRNIVLYYENEGEQPTCWYFYTTNGKRIEIELSVGTPYVSSIINEKGNEWYERNRGKNYIFEITGEDELNRLDNNFKTMDTDPLQLEQQNGNPNHSDTESEDKKGWKTWQKILAYVTAVIVIAGAVYVIKDYVDNRKAANQPTTSSSDTKNGKFEVLLNSANNNTQAAFVNTLNNKLSLLNKYNKAQLTLAELIAIKIVENSNTWPRDEISNIFNGVDLDEDAIFEDYRSGFLKTVYNLATTNNSNDLSDIIDVNISDTTKGYNFLLENESAVEKHLPSLYKKFVSSINKDTATWQDYAVIYAAYIRFGGLKIETLREINSKWHENAVNAIKKIDMISANCYNSTDGNRIDEYTSAWDEEYAENTNFNTDLVDFNRFKAVRLLIAKDSFEDVDTVSLRLDEIATELEESTTEYIEQTTEEPTTEKENTTAYQANNQGTSKNYYDTTQQHYDSDYSTLPEDYNDYTTENYDDNSKQQTTEYFIQENTTQYEEPATPNTESNTTEYFATSEDDDEWWLTEGDVVGMSTNEETKPVVFVKKI